MNDALRNERDRADQAAVQALLWVADAIANQRDVSNSDRSPEEGWSVVDHRDGRYLGKTVALRIIRNCIEEIESAAARTDVPAPLNEVDRLRNAIEDAPYWPECRRVVSHGVDPCNCWKSELYEPEVSSAP